MSVVRSHVTRSIRFVLASTCESCEIIARRDDIGMMTHHGAVQVLRASACVCREITRHRESSTFGYVPWHDECGGMTHPRGYVSFARIGVCMASPFASAYVC